MANQLDSLLQLHTAALTVRGFRQQLLASNIANADTPEYRARDVDFSASLQRALAGVNAGVELARTAPAHLAQAAATAGASAVLYRTVMQPSLDGNTVDMDVERSQFADNAIHYEASLMFINTQLKQLLTAIQG